MPLGIAAPLANTRQAQYHAPAAAGVPPADRPPDDPLAGPVLPRSRRQLQAVQDRLAAPGRRRSSGSRPSGPSTRKAGSRSTATSTPSASTPAPSPRRPSSRRRYNISIVALEEAKGTLLAYDNIAVAEGPHPRKAYIQARDQQAAHRQSPDPARRRLPPDADQRPGEPSIRCTPQAAARRRRPRRPIRPTVPAPAGPLGPPPTPVAADGPGRRAADALASKPAGRGRRPPPSCPASAPAGAATRPASPTAGRRRRPAAAADPDATAADSPLGRRATRAADAAPDPIRHRGAGRSSTRRSAPTRFVAVSDRRAASASDGLTNCQNVVDQPRSRSARITADLLASPPARRSRTRSVRHLIFRKAVTMEGSHGTCGGSRRRFLKTAAATGARRWRRPTWPWRPRPPSRSPRSPSARPARRSPGSAWEQAGPSTRASSRLPARRRRPLHRHGRGLRERQVAEKTIGEVLERTRQAQGRLPRHQDARPPQGPGAEARQDLRDAAQRQPRAAPDRLRRRLLHPRDRPARRSRCSATRASRPPSRR